MGTFLGTLTCNNKPMLHVASNAVTREFKKNSRNGLRFGLPERKSVHIERGPGRGLSQAPPGPGWAGKRPEIDDLRSHKLKNLLTALEL